MWVMEEWHLFVGLVIVYGAIVYWWVIKRVFEGYNNPG